MGRDGQVQSGREERWRGTGMPSYIEKSSVGKTDMFTCIAARDKG